MVIREQRLQGVLDSLVSAGAAGVLLEYRDPEGTWVGSSGTAEIGTTSPVDPTGSFRIGSVTKTFTATVVLQLVGEGILSLDDHIERWLPGLVPAGDGISLRQLLNHTSGLHNYTDDLPGSTEIIRDRFLHWDPRETVAAAAVRDRLFEPGARYSYSNTNFVVLGLVIEAATERSYELEVAQRILRPVNLQHTLAPGDESALPKPHARGYMTVADELVDVTDFNMSQAWAAGAFVSTASDLNHFYAALLSGKLLNPAELQALQTTVATDEEYHASGLGIVRISLPGLTLWGHSGGIYGYRTLSYHSADTIHQVTLSLSTTDDYQELQTYDVLRQLTAS